MMRLCLLIFVVGISFTLVAQKAEFKGYIILRDSAKYAQGKIFYSKETPRSLKFKRSQNDPETEFNPSEIKEFGTKDGAVYVSELIGGRYQFLRQLVVGENSLLMLMGRSKENQTFYLKNKTLLKLPRESHKSQIETILEDKRHGNQIAKRTKYNELSLSRAFTYSHSNNFFYPKVRYGILAGLTGKSIELESDKILNFEPVSFMSYGAFVDIPISVFSQFSTRIEVQYSESSHALFVDGETTFNYLAKVQSISLPVLLRRRFSSTSNINFFSNIGGIFKQNFISSNQVITVSESPTIIRVSELSVPEQVMGGAIGAGIEYSLSHRKDLGLEVRYQHLVSLEETKMIESTFQVIAAFNF